MAHQAEEIVANKATYNMRIEKGAQASSLNHEGAKVRSFKLEEAQAGSLKLGGAKVRSFRLEERAVQPYSTRCEIETAQRRRSDLKRGCGVKETSADLRRGKEELQKLVGKLKYLWRELDVLRVNTSVPGMVQDRLKQGVVLSLLVSLNSSYGEKIKQSIKEDKQLDVYGISELFECTYEGYKKSKKLLRKRRRYRMLSKTHINMGKCRKSVVGECSYSAYMGSSVEDGQIMKKLEAKGADDVITKGEWDEFVKYVYALATTRRQGAPASAYTSSKPIIIDSGASHHMISDRSLMSEIKAATGHVLVANGTKVPIEGVGNLKLFEKNSAAFYLPQFTSNLISVRKATIDLNCQVVFRPNDVEFQDLKTGRVIGKGDSKNQLYHLQTAKASNPIGFYVWTAPCLSRDSNKYFVTFIDERSKYTWLTLLPSKDRVLEAFMNFQAYVSNQYNATVKILRSDNGGEYTSNAFKSHLAKHGIRFWGDAVQTACYLINRTPTKILKNLSPFEVLNKSKPVIDHLRVFGCVCYVMVPGEQRNKLEEVKVSREVKFMESRGYYEEKKWEDLEDLSHGQSDKAATLRIVLERLGIDMSRNQAEEAKGTTPLDHEGRMDLNQEVENVAQSNEEEQGEPTGINEQGVQSGEEEQSGESTGLEEEVHNEVHTEDQVETLRRAQG
ncbi:uncharacterized protein LOC130506717 [Raphanus sativus]|uniref:Uncharacterized protein LOC130506717 n=1 Tax=Raphanus sativus TaxID=3726 RepID=A0A9W3D0X8_RAPSA|nr:uncharacterized protein LOC130506717 [Raphanus sativus]